MANLINAASPYRGADRGLRPRQRAIAPVEPHTLRRFTESTDHAVAALYVGAAFAVDARRATAALIAKLDALQPAEQTVMALRVLPSIFGDRFEGALGNPRTLDFDSLGRLVRVAFRTIRLEDDRPRRNGVVYSFEERDHAEQAREAAFNQLVKTPGRATYALLLRLAQEEGFPVRPARLRELARERAAKDSESEPWVAAEAHAFEVSGETAPRTARDLQRLTMRRIDDMQHELLHGDFAQGATLSGLGNEAAVQNWVADRLRLKQGRAYSVEREPHVVDENEPDVRLRARATDASVPMEIKIAESWSMRELEAALRDQLCGRYSRAREGRHGVLLLVHQVPRSRGWEDPDHQGTFLIFGETVARLRGLASDIAAQSPDAPQPEVAALDVSQCADSEQSDR